jgi:FkbM family methyltransferase
MSSQYGQDYFVLEVLGGLRDGFFLDAGAADGIKASNTQRLEAEFGWNGICIEPNAALFDALVRNRRCHCLNCCLYDRDGTVDFLEQANMLGGILDEYHPAHLQIAKAIFHIRDNADGRPPTVRKATRTVRAVLRACAAPPVIDYFSLDTEGSEFAILQSFPFDEYSFRVLTVEHNRLPVRHQIRAFLQRHGYLLITTMEIDDCYINGGLLLRPSWRSSVWTWRGRASRHAQ